MDIGIEEVGLALVAIIIIVVIGLSATSSSGALNPLVDWFSGFGKNKWQIMCESKLNGEWCQKFFGCSTGHAILSPPEYSGDSWRCCEKGWCIAQDNAGYAVSEQQQGIENLDVEFYLERGSEKTVLYSSKKNEKKDSVSAVCGENGIQDVVFAISHPDIKEFGYRISTKKIDLNQYGHPSVRSYTNLNLAGMGKLNVINGVLASGVITEPKSPVSVRVPFAAGVDDTVIMLQIWSLDSKNDPFISKVVLGCQAPARDKPKLQSGKNHKAASDINFRDEALNSPLGSALYVYGAGQLVLSRAEKTAEEKFGERLLYMGTSTISIQTSVSRTVTSSYYAYKKFRDFKVEKVEADKLYVFAWTGSKWQLLDCEMDTIWGSAFSLKTSKLQDSPIIGTLSGTMTETVYRNCMKMDFSDLDLEQSITEETFVQ
ncbi:MAG: hypothetical protein FJY76_02220 [Candidatus Aenigmarchaeota archaeon]|nr:hypothetical protein [Candidatus Aenigmarchaeota archaeon]